MPTKSGNLTFSNFKAGLDTRRSELTSVPGALKQLIDGHVNQGAEIEKRKAFVPVFYKPAQTFGALPGPTGVYIFGSRNLPTIAGNISVFLRAGNVVTLTLAADVGLLAGDTIHVNITSPQVYSGTFRIATVTSGGTVITYAEVGSPLGMNPVTGTATFVLDPNNLGIIYGKVTPPDVNGTPLTMTGAVMACLFNSFPFLVATFSDGHNYSFYNGTLVNDFISGIVGIGTHGLLTDTAIANSIVDQVNLTNQYTATNPNNTRPIIAGENGRSFSLTAIEDSATESLNTEQASVPSGSTNAQNAVGSFRLVAGATSSKVTSVKVNSVEVLGTDVIFAVSTSNTAGLVAVQINEYCDLNSLPYTALSNGDTVNITSTVAGAAENGYDIQVTTLQAPSISGTAAGLCCGIEQFSLNSTGAGATLTISSITVGGGANILTGSHANTDMGALAIDVAKDINQNSATYIALGVSVPVPKGTKGLLNIAKRVTSSADTQLAVVVTYTASAGTVTIAEAGATSTFSAACSPNTVSCFTFEENTQACQVIAKGGTPPYTYSWALTAGATGDFIILAPTSPITAFKYIGSFFQTSSSCVATCTITDSFGPPGNVITVTCKVNYNPPK